jgi:hypothetical protein
MAVGIASLAVVVALVSGTSETGGAATKGGVVTGSLRVFGGVSSAPKFGSPVSGDVVFKPSHGKETKIMVGMTGRFDIRLAAGTYTAFGGPLGWHNDCLGNHGKPFKVAVGERSKVIIACDAE